MKKLVYIITCTVHNQATILLGDVCAAYYFFVALDLFNNGMEDWHTGWLPVLFFLPVCIFAAVFVCNFIYYSAKGLRQKKTK